MDGKHSVVRQIDSQVGIKRREFHWETTNARGVDNFEGRVVGGNVQRIQSELWDSATSPIHRFQGGPGDPNHPRARAWGHSKKERNAMLFQLSGRKKLLIYIVYDDVFFD